VSEEKERAKGEREVNFALEHWEDFEKERLGFLLFYAVYIFLINS
jgi:hypothetical protein